VRRIVVTVVVVVALLAGLGASAIWAVGGMRQAARAAAAATAYCAALQQEKDAAAYALLTPATQAQSTRAIFTLSAELQDGVDGPITRCVVPAPGLDAGLSLGPGGDHVTLSMRIARHTLRSGTIALAQVGGAWRVESVSPALAGTDVGPLVAEEQFCAALRTKDYTSAEQALASAMRAQLPAARLGMTFGQSAFTTLTGCAPDLSAYHLAGDDANAQVRADLAITPQGAALPLILPLAFTFTHTVSAATPWAISGVALAAPNLPPASARAAFGGAPHLPASAPAAPTLSAAAALLVNPATGEVYLARNANAERAMASTTKITTALVALTFGSLDQEIPVTSAVDSVDYGNCCSVAGLRVGDVLTLRDLLYALLLPSGDDAAVVIADGIAGSQDAFVALMNMEASLLRLQATHYDDVHGLGGPTHYTTARDLATLAAYALHDAAFAQIVRTAYYQLPAKGYCWANTNLLLPGLDQQTCPPPPGYGGVASFPGATGVKTGWTGDAGGCLVFSAQEGSHQLLGVVMGEPGVQTAADLLRFNDAAALLQWGFGLEQKGL
jgi:D-alanyl-D-alanine carboxypeptidase (penicillin-binding protein 5/6)